MYATYRKYNDAWCVKVVGDAKPGDAVEVTLKDGRVKQETLGELVAVEENRDGQRLPVFAVIQKPRERKVEDVGNLAGVLGLFAKAKAHLKYPKIVLSVPEINETIKINVAGDRAMVPGSLNVVSTTKIDARGRNVWYGRIHIDGRYECSGNANDAVTKRLREFATDPVKVAGDHGRLTGNCCFCHLPLKDERSTAVGYGKICASHYSLPWGSNDEAILKKAS
jgi:hypothetical protein